MPQPNPRARTRTKRDGSGVRHSRSLVDARELGQPQVAAQVYGMTDRGRVREHNEDHFLVAELERSLLVEHSSVEVMAGTNLTESPQGKLLIVADGMGGYGNGEIASSIAVDALARYAFAVMPWLLRHTQASEQELTDALRRALEHCHKQVKRTAVRQGLDRRMGTTLTLAYITWPELHIAHVGDSRCYLFRAGTLRALTRDHTLAEQLVDEKALSPEEAQRSRFRHVLVNSVGGSSDLVGVELHTLELREGDQLMLCSDGLTGQLSDPEIAQHLTQPIPIDAAVSGMIRAANEAGGADNITVVLARF
jgi:PPM family protein phosphatase